MNIFLTADYIFDGQKILKNATLELKEDGSVVSLGQAQNNQSAEHYHGLIMPGFINTHCHLELSHLQSKVPTGTGLLPFLRSVVSMRDVDEDVVMKAIEKQDSYMWNMGIQAVGDISNKVDTAQTKTKSPIRYFTFIEMFDLLQPSFTENSFSQYAEVYKLFDRKNGNDKSASPHAPYTVTSDLFSKISSLNTGKTTVSIHNQETVHEDQYFLDKSGGFSKFFGDLGISDEEFKPPGKQSIYYAMENMDSQQKTLFVHNTQSTVQNIEDALRWNPNSYWASCPNANLYIENRLPDYQAFIDSNAKLTIGTDSLSSNWQLSVLEELKTIQKYNSFIPVETLLRWSTINGAEALSMDDTLGSFGAGKTPGVIQLEGFDGHNLESSTVKRIM